MGISLADVAYYTRDKKKPNVPCIMYRDIGEELKLCVGQRVKETFFIELLCDTYIISRLKPASANNLSN